MKIVERLERLIRPIAIPNLTMLLVFSQAITFLLTMGPNGNDIYWKLSLDSRMVHQGEVWRLLTFMILPPTTHPIWAFFALYIFYIMGTALENEWGTVRYNLYLFIAWLATILAAFFLFVGLQTNAFIGGSVFLAFAFLFPDFVLYIFFILPVKIKWLALITWIFYGYEFITGDWGAKAYVVASVANFLIFFSKDIVLRIKSGKRRMETQARAVAQRNIPFHVCAACGVTEKVDPKMEFRVCLTCDGGLEYCEVHLRDHDHVYAEAPTRNDGGF